MKEKTKTVIAFVILGILILAGTILTVLDRPDDVFPDKDTQIRLYGETHGVGEYYDLELAEWKACYKDGCRNLFVELPYYSAEFLNLWMHEESDELLDRFFEEIRGTASDTDGYRTFLCRIKADCPETVFSGTDVGHQYGTTGARYLQYLTEHGREGSEEYALAEECIRQGEEFSAEHSESGISSFREDCMTANFIAAYDRCGGGKIMGIYGSYHTDLKNPEVMAGRLKETYGDVIGSVKMSTLAVLPRPYRPGFCVSGLVFLLMLMLPNMIWAAKKKPEGYEEAAAREDRRLLALERVGEIGVSACLLVFPAFNPCIRSLPGGGFYIGLHVFFWVLAFALMILYECFWIRYFKSPGTMKDFYRSYAGFPLAGATLPVIAALLLGVYAGNLVMITSAAVLGVGHIGIHRQHQRELAG